MIQYTVSFENANAHIFDVSLAINSPLNAGQSFYLPNWIPGSYMIRDFARNLIGVKAYCGDKPVALIKHDKSSWQIEQFVESLTVRYQVYAWDLSVRSAHLDNQHGFFNGTSLLLGIKGMEELPHQVKLVASEWAQKNNWQGATAMPAIAVDQAGFGIYQSENYEELIDHPFEIAALQSVEFDVCGVPHKMVFTEAPARVDWPRIARDVKQICETEVAFFGDKKPPFEHYLFMTFVQKKGFGGLEHRASTALHCSFNDLPLVGEDNDKITPEYRTFLSLCCHEYFHNWNVKRIKPARFIPLDLSREINTELLWFFEGITSYYDELLMVRAGVIEPSSYLDMLAQTITRVYRSQGRHQQTVTESSFDAWTKFYKQDENAVNSLVSYYTKGALIALCLDFEIRELTENKKSLDDLMRIIWQDYGNAEALDEAGQIVKGLGEKEVKQLVENMVGQSMDEFFNQALYSTDDLNLQKVFNQLSINFQLLPQYLQAEKGGFVTAVKDRPSVAFLAITHQDNPLGAQVISVVEGGCASQCGISNGDIIIAIDGVRVTSSELDTTIARIPVESEISISYFRRERLYQVNCKLSESLANTCYLSLTEEAPCETLLNWTQGLALKN